MFFLLKVCTDLIQGFNSLYILEIPLLLPEA